MVHRVVAAVGSTSTAPVIFPASKPSSMNCVGFNACPQHDCPSLNPHWSRPSCSSAMGLVRAIIIHSYSLKRMQRSDIGR